MPKLFKQVNDWDWIYQINPFTEAIESLKVKEIKGLSDPTYRNCVPSTQQNKEWVSITYYRSEKLLQVENLKHAHTVEIIVDGTQTTMLVAIKLEGTEVMFPVPFSADHKALLEWQQRTK